MALALALAQAQALALALALSTVLSLSIASFGESTRSPSTMRGTSGCVRAARATAARPFSSATELVLGAPWGGQKARFDNRQHVTTLQRRAPVLDFSRVRCPLFSSVGRIRMLPEQRANGSAVFGIMAGFLRRLSLRHAVAGGVLGVSGLSLRAHALRIEEDTKLDFKDVLLRPKRSELSSRAQVCAHPENMCP